MNSESVYHAFELLGRSWTPWLVVIPGLIAGLVGGAIPGLSGVMVLALLLPLTIHMDLFTALMFMTAMFTGAGFGSSIPGILMGLPGSTSSVAADKERLSQRSSGVVTCCIRCRFNR